VHHVRSAEADFTRGAVGDDVAVLEEHCRVRLAACKVPTSWEVVEELPKTSTGKIDKKPLREKLAAAAG